MSLCLPMIQQWLLLPTQKKKCIRRWILQSSSSRNRLILNISKSLCIEFYTGYHRHESSNACKNKLREVSRHRRQFNIPFHRSEKFKQSPNVKSYLLTMSFIVSKDFWMFTSFLLICLLCLLCLLWCSSFL